MCNCSACKRGRKNRGNQAMIRGKRKGARAKVHSCLRIGEVDVLPDKVYIGYTD